MSMVVVAFVVALCVVMAAVVAVNETTPTANFGGPTHFTPTA